MWYTQAFVVWEDGTGQEHHEYYWDLPNTDAAHKAFRVSPASWGEQNPPSPALNWGDAPWNPGNEVYDGVLRGIRIYNTALSEQDMLSESNNPLSTAVQRQYSPPTARDSFTNPLLIRWLHGTGAATYTR